MENFDKRQMEELLPDYLFGKLGEEEANNFRANLPKYPDIEEELAAAQKVFARLENMDMSKVFDKKAVNLSVNVHNKLNKKELKAKKRSLLSYAIPVAALIAFMMVWFGYFPKKHTESPKMPAVATNVVNAEQKEYFSESDLKSIFDTQSESKNPQKVSKEVQSIDNIEAQFEEIDVSENAIIAELENMDEADFQSIMEDLKK